jgi:hypothetical protein
MDIEKAITDGIVFKGGKSSGRKNEEKVKTKAKKKSYITGLHGSAKMKADIRKKRANRHKGK